MLLRLTPAEVIQRIKDANSGNKFELDSLCAQYLSGDCNKENRRQVLQIVTGERLPLSRCGVHAVADVLHAHFQQLTIF